MFEQQYDEEMTAVIRRLEAKKRAETCGHPEWDNACSACGCRLYSDAETCDVCAPR